MWHITLLKLVLGSVISIRCRKTLSKSNVQQFVIVMSFQLNCQNVSRPTETEQLKVGITLTSSSSDRSDRLSIICYGSAVFRQCRRSRALIELDSTSSFSQFNLSLKHFRHSDSDSLEGSSRCAQAHSITLLKFYLLLCLVCLRKQ